jgi:hypothetical protein
MKDDSYQGYEVRKHRAKMMGKMYLQLFVLCLADCSWFCCCS